MSAPIRARDLVPCRCDACHATVEHGLPGDEHWSTHPNASWSDGRGGVKRGTILRRCKRNGTLHPIHQGHQP